MTSSMASRVCAPVRALARKPTGSDRKRRKANSSTAAEDASSHCTSSTATTTGVGLARAPRMSSRARLTARWSGGCEPGSSSNSATPRACLRGARSDVRALSSTPASRSERPANEIDASASTARQERTTAPLWRASSTAWSQRRDLPMPASPASSSAAGPPPTRSRKPAIAPSSDSRAITPRDIVRHHSEPQRAGRNGRRLGDSTAQRSPAVRSELMGGQRAGRR